MYHLSLYYLTIILTMYYNTIIIEFYIYENYISIMVNNILYTEMIVL
jgi:hypothetical protein